MKTTRIMLLALVLAGTLAGSASASTSIAAGSHRPSGRAAVDVGFFYDDLAPYGNWVETPEPRLVLVPRHAHYRHWRPL